MANSAGGEISLRWTRIAILVAKQGMQAEQGEPCMRLATDRPSLVSMHAKMNQVIVAAAALSKVAEP